jgi:hypothetical protein
LESEPVELAVGVRVPSAMVYTDDERNRAASILLGPDGGAEVLARIRERALNPKARTASFAALYADIVGWTGTKSQLLGWLVAQLGVSMLAAQSAVRQVQRAPRDPHEIARTCREYLHWYDGPNGPSRDASIDAGERHGTASVITEGD